MSGLYQDDVLEIPAEEKSPLNEAQTAALDEIMAAYSLGGRHLLTGYAGSGKTYLVQYLAKVFRESGRSVVLTAPTHKAVSVLRRKMNPDGEKPFECTTIHSLLQLKPGKPQGDKLVFERKARAEPVGFNVVIIDECSMLGAELMMFIRRHLPQSFVLFVGDPAQLPPVGEEASQSFMTKSCSHLDTIVRQAVGNPILEAAHIIRDSQATKALDWSWCAVAKADTIGVFIPKQPDTWLKRAFMSEAFAEDPDTFRYLCWTNDRVAAVNDKVRRWIYGGRTATPFMPGESILVRAPIMDKENEPPLVTTNEEVVLVDIEAAFHTWKFRSVPECEAWSQSIPIWRLRVRKEDDSIVTFQAPRDERAYKQILGRLSEEARDNRERWQDFFWFKERMAQLQAVYALTVHNSQGSTFKHVFMDVSDIRRRGASNVLECQQLCYVAATRSTHTLNLIGV